MNKKSDGPGLSSVELVVLARYSAGKKLSEADLSSALSGFQLEASGALVRQTAKELTERGLLTMQPPKKPKAPKRTKKGAPPPPPPPAGPVIFEVSELKLSDDGARALRATFGVVSTPSWTEVRDSYLPALALGLAPGSAAAKEASSNLPMSLLRLKLKMPGAASLNAVCDKLLFRRLGFEMSKVTLADLRARVLAEDLGIKDITTAKGVVEKAVCAWTGVEVASKKLLVTALSRRWLADQSNHWLHDGSPPLGGPPKPAAEPAAAAASPLSLDALAAVVHDALPRIGTDGRFGSEKVFVSAVWRGLETERRLPAMTLESFKRNLVQAMRAGKLRLARADLIGAMDAKLVSESEISDAGSTFHFVVEQREGSGGNGRRAHV